MKNIPLPSKKEYILALITAVEKFIKNLRWRAFFFLNPSDRPEKETYGFKTMKATPKIEELKQLEERLRTMIRDLEFRKFSNDFQDKMKRDLNEIINDSHVIVAADKTSNHYKLTPEQYNDLLQKYIQKDYRKVRDGEVAADISEQKDIVTKLKIEDRVPYVAPQSAFVTMKDTKDNFQNDPKCRLLNPTKVEIGKPSKKVLSRVVEKIRNIKQYNLWVNTDSVIRWFEGLKDKSKLRFITYDIADYYGSISEDIFRKAVNWAKTLVNISEDEEELLYSSKRSLLSDGKDLWKKKGEKDFTIAMGSWDGAESTDLVGLYLLSELEKKLKANGQPVNPKDHGLYRDDGCLVTISTARVTEILAQDLAKIFHSYGLKLEIDANHKKINFLDVTLDLMTGLYSPYKKKNNIIKYINNKSNHPPAILKNIPENVEDRMTRNSANEEIFEEAIKPYQDALDSSGFNHQLKFKPAVKLKQQQPPQQRKKNRQRRITWFNPPYSLNVKTNVGKMFLQIVKDCFPPTHKLYKICNRNTIKISYRTMPNMKRNISKSNNKKLQERREEQHPELKKVPHCNCQTRNKARCPMPGQCNQDNVVYRAHVTRTDNGHKESYTGASTNFKTRWNGHRRSFRKEEQAGDTKLSGYIWKELKGQDNNNQPKGIPHYIEWEVKDRGPPWNPTTDTCRLCTLEKYHIMFNPAGATLNQRDEFFSHCYHKTPQLLIQK